jgi:MarR family transcriptional regulator, negative regulator of the multidrug operon emrRAB
MGGMLYLRDLPKYESIRQQAQRYPQIDPRAVESFLVLLRVASDVLGGFEALLAQFGMSQGKFTVLMVLNRDPAAGLSPSELADRCGVTRATMTGLLDGLEREKLIHREGNATDRRKAVVRLAGKATKLLDRILPSYYSQVASLMGDLREEQKVQLIDLLAKVNDRLLCLWEASRRAGVNHTPGDPSGRGSDAGAYGAAPTDSPAAKDP